jgi:hypothetical protein
MSRSVKTLISPEQAVDWLRQEPPGARARNQQTVERYAAVMRDGAWRAAKGDAIHIRSDGTIAEGGHRLRACIVAQTSFEAYLLNEAPRRSARYRRTKMPTTPERLIAARAAAKTIAEEITAAQGVRGEALRTDDDVSAERADQELITLRLRAARIADKIAMLEPEAEAEKRRALDWPQDLETTLSRIDELQVRHDALARKRSQRGRSIRTRQSRFHDPGAAQARRTIAGYGRMKPTAEFAGITKFECCSGCTIDKCLISGINVCGHPYKTGLQAGVERVPGAPERYARAKRAVDVWIAERTTDGAVSDLAGAMPSADAIAAMSPADADAKLTELQSSKAWCDAFLKNSGAEVKTFKALVEKRGPDFRLDQIAAGNTVPLPDIDVHTGDQLTLHNQVRAADSLRAQGVEPAVIKQLLKGEPVSQAEFDAAAKAKADLLGNKEFVTKWLSGDREAVRQMTLLSIILVSGKKAA